MVIRAIAEQDVPALFEVRVATDENRLTREQLGALGITEGSVVTRMRGTYKGWLAEVDGRVVGFAMGDRATGEMWVIAVLPDYCRRGIGGELLARIEAWLRDSGWEESWLTTDIDLTLRAYAFYRHRGWEDREIRDGLRYMRKRLGPRGEAVPGPTP